ncbi:MAG: MBL fold metallo-hydrolase [Polyangiaceae bacterium]|jgi:glyoxylase-like metal-dependent hydrolase (beta-lactamase superfamily II)
MKRALQWVGLAVLVLLIAAGSLWYSAFGNNSPIVDGQLLAPGVETVKDGFVSVFMLDAGPGKVALIDAGKDGSGKAILAALARRGLTPAAVAAIFLTHGHGDHTAGCKLFPDAQVYALENEVSLIGTAAKVTHALNDGDTADVGDLHMEVFAMPGHTPGSAVYLARGVLFFGDSAGAAKDGTMMKAVPLFSKDPAQNVASLKALSARLQPRMAEIKTLAFAHTGPLVAVQPLFVFAASH